MAESENEQRFDSWCPVVGFELLYEVSDLGRVRRSGKAHRSGAGRGGGARLGRVIANCIDRSGYLAVNLWKEGKIYRRLLHRVVAEAFLGPIPDGQEVNHRDGNKHNPVASNLEYVTRSENILHAIATGLKTHERALTDTDVAEIRRLHIEEKLGCRKLAKLFGISKTTALHVIYARGAYATEVA